MEYPLKLSEVVAGCESGAWLDGSIFESSHGYIIRVERNLLRTDFLINFNTNWRFIGYAD